MVIASAPTTPVQKKLVAAGSDRPTVGEDAVSRKLRGAQDRQDHFNPENRTSRVQRQHDTDKTCRDGKPAPPSDTFTEKRHRHGGNHQWVTCEHHLPSDKSDQHETEDRGADLGNQKNATQCLQPGVFGACDGTEAARPCHAEADDKQKKEPVANGNDAQHAVAFGKKTRQAVLKAEGHRRAEHQQDSKLGPRGRWWACHAGCQSTGSMPCDSR